MKVISAACSASRPSWVLVQCSPGKIKRNERCEFYCFPVMKFSPQMSKDNWIIKRFWGGHSSCLPAVTCRWACLDLILPDNTATGRCVSRQTSPGPRGGSLVFHVMSTLQTQHARLDLYHGSDIYTSHWRLVIAHMQESSCYDAIGYDIMADNEGLMYIDLSVSFLWGLFQ